ncbi:hypothetical protein [Streptomyces sp. NPDC058486]|uniref:hypothetical protein n=1 Tax=unclassified Streptomyces TaxID=2593676 RepID=UPI00365B5848
MAHTMCALVVAGQLDTQRALSVGLRARLTHEGISVFPIDHYFSAYWAAVRGNSAQLDLPDGIASECVTFPSEAVLHDLAREVTDEERPRFAIIQTDYFAGAGGQWAAAFHGQERVTPDQASINHALAVLGVRSTTTADEFDTIGLGEFRSNPDYLHAYVDLCEERGA